MCETNVDPTPPVCDLASSYAETLVIRGFSRSSRENAARLQGALRERGVESSIAVAALLHRSHGPLPRGERLLIDATDGDTLDAARVGAVLEADVLMTSGAVRAASESAVLAIRDADDGLLVVHDIASRRVVATFTAAIDPRILMIDRDHRREVRLGADARIIVQPTTDGMSLRFDGEATTHAATRVRLGGGASAAFDGGRPRRLTTSLELATTLLA